MTCNDIYNHAMSLIAESPDSAVNDDYKERTGYLLASFCTEISRIDIMYREALGLPGQQPFSSLELALTDEFPLSERFAPVAAYFLASTLIADENYELSDKFYERYSDALSSLADEVPASVETITDNYGFDFY